MICSNFSGHIRKLTNGYEVIPGLRGYGLGIVGKNIIKFAVAHNLVKTHTSLRKTFT